MVIVMVIVMGIVIVIVIIIVIVIVIVPVRYSKLQPGRLFHFVSGARPCFDLPELLSY